MKEKALTEDTIATHVTPLLAIHSGGKDDNWLMNLREGTVFLAKEKFVPGPSTGQTDKQPELIKFTLVHKWTKSCQIIVEMGTQKIESPVHALIFSRKYEFIEAILVPAKEEGLWVTS